MRSFSANGISSVGGTPFAFDEWGVDVAITASHGFLDAFTNGGLGVAFFSPFDPTRYFFPWTPIEVSPIGAVRFFSQRGLLVIISELRWVWLPSLALGLILRRPTLPGKSS